MESSKRLNQNNTNQNNIHLQDEPGNRPLKFQKISNKITGFSGNYINIPEFAGPTPTYQSHHTNNQHQNPSHNETLQQQTNNYQENHYQEGQRTPPTAQNNGHQSSNSPSTSEEGPFCWYQEDLIQEGIQNCQQSLIGKLLTEKIIPKQIIQNTLLGIWGNPKGFQLSEVEGGFYHITMENNKDIQRALKGNPWIIRNSWLMVQPWDREKDPKDLEFHKVPIWLQLWGLPLHCKTIAMGKHLGSQLGMVEDAALYDFPDKARIIKIKVQIDTNQPIRPGIFIGNTKDGIKWVDFRYENLPMFCFLCGCIGHNDTTCNNQNLAMEEGATNPRGPWLRSTSFGRRINEKRDPRFNSNPMKSMSGGCFSPIPKAMLEMLAKMTLEEEAAASPGNNKQPQEQKEGEGNGSNNKAQPSNNTDLLAKINTNNYSQQVTEVAGLQSKASQAQ
ncbi:hypothetical protein QL285_041841 [Trifolium repens]|nr:hypothetical protein QL285_041841 [Trifolium repens]